MPNETRRIMVESLTIGGYLKDIPRPWRRYFDDKRRKRKLRISIGTFSIGVHYFVTIHQEDNPIWDCRTHAEERPDWKEIQETEYGNEVICWHKAWDDKEGEGIHLSEKFDTQFQAKKWIDKQLKRFPQHQVVWDSPDAEWIYKNTGD